MGAPGRGSGGGGVREAVHVRARAGSGAFFFQKMFSKCVLKNSFSFPVEGDDSDGAHNFKAGESMF